MGHPQATLELPERILFRIIHRPPLRDQLLYFLYSLLLLKTLTDPCPILGEIDSSKQVNLMSAVKWRTCILGAMDASIEKTSRGLSRDGKLSTCLRCCRCIAVLRGQLCVAFSELTEIDSFCCYSHVRSTSLHPFMK